LIIVLLIIAYILNKLYEWYYRLSSIPLKHMQNENVSSSAVTKKSY